MRTITSADGTALAFEQAGTGPALILVGGAPGYGAGGRDGTPRGRSPPGAACHHGASAATNLTFHLEDSDDHTSYAGHDLPDDRQYFGAGQGHGSRPGPSAGDCHPRMPESAARGGSAGRHQGNRPRAQRRRAAARSRGARFGARRCTRV